MAIFGIKDKAPPAPDRKAVSNRLTARSGGVLQGDAGGQRMTRLVSVKRKWTSGRA